VCLPASCCADWRLKIEGAKMRFLGALLAMWALSGIATAQPFDCKSISGAAAQLGCYNRAAPQAKPSTKMRRASRPKPVSKLDSEKYVDSISAEDTLMNARLKNICRGC
jgi:hypothetical protein